MPFITQDISCFQGSF